MKVEELSDLSGNVHATAINRSLIEKPKWFLKLNFISHKCVQEALLG